MRRARKHRERCDRLPGGRGVVQFHSWRSTKQNALGAASQRLRGFEHLDDVEMTLI